MYIPGVSPSLLRLPIAGDGRFLDTLTVALTATSCKQGWYTSTKELQLASLSCCVACRSVRTLRLPVDMSVPHRFWVDGAIGRGPAVDDTRQGAGASASTKRHNSSRVPAIKVHTVEWKLPPSMLAWGGDIFTNMECLILDGGFNDSVDEVVWPRGLKRLIFGSSFNQPVESASFPPSLEGMGFGMSFNQPVEGVAWPASLEIIMFCPAFAQPVGKVRWPASLKTLLIGFRRQAIASQPRA